jgi:hypothetical protein
MDEDKYIFFESPNDKLVRDLKIEGDDLAFEMEVWNGAEWVNYYGNASDLVRLDPSEAAVLYAQTRPPRRV